MVVVGSDIKEPAALRRIGIERKDRNLLSQRVLDHLVEGAGVGGPEDDAVDVLRDVALEHRHLTRDILLWRIFEVDIRVGPSPGIGQALANLVPIGMRDFAETAEGEVGGLDGLVRRVRGRG